MPRVDLAAEHWRIPDALASRYQRVAKAYRLTRDDLLSEGYAALMAAWRLYDPCRVPGYYALSARAQDRSLGGYLVWAVEWKIRNYIWPKRTTHEWRWRRLLIADERVFPTDALLDTTHDPADLAADHEARERLERLVLDVAGEQDGTLILAFYLHGRRQADLGKELGVSKARVQQRVARGMERLRAKLC